METVVKVVREYKLENVNTYLATGRWILLDAKAIQRPGGDHYDVCLLGWLGPYDPEFPEEDSSEFPAGLR